MKKRFPTEFVLLLLLCCASATLCWLIVRRGGVVSGGQRPAAFGGGDSQAVDVPISDLWERESFRDWIPKRFFDDPKVIQLCDAIGQRDYERIDRLVKTEGADINRRGFADVTPLFWAFPLGFIEARGNLPKDKDGRLILSELGPHQEKAFREHADLLEHLLKLGADPNVKTTRGDIDKMLQMRKYLVVPVSVFQMYDGLAVTHLTAQLYWAPQFNFFPIVMANGGKPNVVLDEKAITPIFFACGVTSCSILERERFSPENVALLIDAGADLEFRDPDRRTPILAAADAGHFSLVYMLIHAGANIYVRGDRGWGLEKCAEDYVGKVKRWRQGNSAPNRPYEVDAYCFDVVRHLEGHGLMPAGSADSLKARIDEAIDGTNKVAYGERDPFVDEWVKKRQEGVAGAAEE